MRVGGGESQPFFIAAHGGSMACGNKGSREGSGMGRSDRNHVCLFAKKGNTVDWFVPAARKRMFAKRGTSSFKEGELSSAGQQRPSAKQVFYDFE